MVFVKCQAGMLSHGQNDSGFWMRCFLEVEWRGLILSWRLQLRRLLVSFLSFSTTYKVL
jgi:hypothetical protein